MADIVLKRGQTATIPYTLVDSAAVAFNLTDYEVRLAIAGRGLHKVIVGANDSPANLGTGAFPVVAADYGAAALKPGVYAFEVWAHDDDNADTTLRKIPFFTGTLEVLDVPQAE